MAKIVLCLKTDAVPLYSKVLMVYDVKVFDNVVEHYFPDKWSVTMF